MAHTPWILRGTSIEMMLCYEAEATAGCVLVIVIKWPELEMICDNDPIMIPFPHLKSIVQIDLQVQATPSFEHLASIIYYICCSNIKFTSWEKYTQILMRLNLETIANHPDILLPFFPKQGQLDHHFCDGV